MEKIDVNVYGYSYPLRVERREVTEKAARDVDSVMRLFAEKKVELEEEIALLKQNIARLNVFIGQNLQ